MYRKKAKGWTKHLDFILLDILCMQLAFVISYIIRFGTDNPYMDNEYRILAIAFLFIDFFGILKQCFFNFLSFRDVCKNAQVASDLTFGVRQQGN